MGKKSGGSPPPPPDPYETAQAQSQQNKETAITQSRLNQIEEVSPYGRSYYEPTGQTRDGVDIYRRTVELSPEQQQLYNQQTQISNQLNTLAGDQFGRVADTLGTPFPVDQLPPAAVAGEEGRNAVVNALYGQYTSRLDPRFQQQETALRTQLADQGITQGSDAYQQALTNFGQERNDAYQGALNQAVAAGGQEQTRLFGLDASARQRALEEAAYLRNLPLNEVTALMGTGPGVKEPQFTNVPRVAVGNTDITTPIMQNYQGQLANYQANQNRRNATIGALAGLGGSLLSGSATAGGFGNLLKW